MSFKMEKIATPLSSEGEEAKMEEDAEWWNIVKIFILNLKINFLLKVCAKFGSQNDGGYLS